MENDINQESRHTVAKGKERKRISKMITTLFIQIKKTSDYSAKDQIRETIQFLNQKRKELK